MLKNVKSSYFTQLIFSDISEGRKLKLLKHNKNLEKEMNINLSNYKFFSRRYIIYESKRKGREFDGFDNLLIYEGEYLNGERNGKGKEYYYKGRLIFEGEYLNGKINGKWKEYNYEGELLFEGEYLNDKRSVKGKEYDDDGKLRFEGEYLDGKQSEGKVYDDQGNMIYEMKIIIGEGTEYWYNGKLEFEGEYLNCIWNGKGTE